MEPFNVVLPFFKKYIRFLLYGEILLSHFIINHHVFQEIFIPKDLNGKSNFLLLFIFPVCPIRRYHHIDQFLSRLSLQP